MTRSSPEPGSGDDTGHPADAAARSRGPELAAATYAELRAVARAQLGRLRPGQTLQPTALVHEAWLRVVHKHGELVGVQERRLFFFTMGRAMRDVLVEEARRRNAIKRGGGQRGETLPTGLVHPVEDDDELLAVHETLDELERELPDHAPVVLLRFFAGLTVEETADALSTSVSSVERLWRFGRAWLRRRLRSDAADEVPPPR